MPASSIRLKSRLGFLHDSAPKSNLGHLDDLIAIGDRLLDPHTSTTAGELQQYRNQARDLLYGIGRPQAQEALRQVSKLHFNVSPAIPDAEKFSKREERSMYRGLRRIRHALAAVRERIEAGQPLFRRKRRRCKTNAELARERSISEVIRRTKCRGRKYCMVLDHHDIRPPAKWIEEGCPSTYAEAYNNHSWRQRIQDEKYRVLKRSLR